MSRNHEEETLFQFDPYDPLDRQVNTPRPGQSPMSPQVADPTSEVLGVDIDASLFKGKERSVPMPIRTSAIEHDLFSLSPPSLASPSSYQTFSPSSSSAAFSPSSCTFSSPDYIRYIHQNSSDDYLSPLDPPSSDSSGPSSPSPSKGKERASVPILPPLSFSHIEFGDCGQGLVSTSAPPESNAVTSSLVIANAPSSSAEHSGRGYSTTEALEAAPEDPYLVSRRRSLSNLSSSLSPQPGSSSTNLHSQLTLGPSQPSNISRQRILQQQQQDAILTNPLILDSFSQASTAQGGSPNLVASEPETTTYQPAWYTVQLPTDLDLSIRLNAECTPAIRPDALVRRASHHIIQNGKIRSKSSPFPISALDYVPVTSTDIFQPLPIVVHNYFDLFLPKELRIRTLRLLVELHETEYQSSITEGRITLAKATSSRNRWVGRNKGVKELVKLSRVSKAWQSLVFDGQLWTDLDLHAFPGLPPHVLTRITGFAGSFSRHLNLAGHVHLLPEHMSEITNELSFTTPNSEMSYTQLTSINLQGCTALTTRSLHHLLVRSKFLEKLVVKGLTAVTNTTCDILVNFCPKLASLNMNKCPNVNAEGIRSMALAALDRREHLLLTELRVCGLKHITDSTMAALGLAAPHLEVLDLSYARQLHNSALEAFVSCQGILSRHFDSGVDSTLVSPRDLGRESNETKLRRRVTKLRHLSLSACVLLTDTACSNLAYSVPRLEFLELAGIGTGLKDSGLIRLLSTTPNVRRLDLEDGVDLTDALVMALTPIPETPLSSPSTSSPSNSRVEEPKQAGHALERLIISYATQITDHALLALIRNCPKLVHLEADNTRIGAAVLREFVRLSHQRKAINAKIVATDCRAVGESLVKELSPMTRPRMGWRAYGARKLYYLDARDDEEDELKIGQDECDEYRVVLKSFYSWQTVDAVRAAKEKRRKSMMRRTGSDSSVNNDAEAGSSSSSGFRGSNRWWSPGGRRYTTSSSRGGGTGNNSPPIIPDINSDGCRAM